MATVWSVPDLFEAGPADLLMAHADGLPAALEAGHIVPIDEMVEASDAINRSDFHQSRYGSVLDTLTYDDQLLGLPIYADTYALFCHTALFAKAGVDCPPRTWEEVAQASAAITALPEDVWGYQQCSFQFPLEIAQSGLE